MRHNSLLRRPRPLSRKNSSRRTSRRNNPLRRKGSSLPTSHRRSNKRLRRQSMHRRMRTGHLIRATGPGQAHRALRIRRLPRGNMLRRLNLLSQFRAV